MPPNKGNGNRIGLAVGIEDSGDSTLQYLREVNRLLREIRQNAGGMSGGASGTGGVLPQQHIAREQAERQVADTAKRRATDVANHQIAEGRRAADAATHFARQTDAELNKLYAGHTAAGNVAVAKQIENEIAARRAQNPYAPGGVLDPNSPQNRAGIERNRRLQQEAQNPPRPPPHIASASVVSREEEFERRTQETQATEAQRERWRRQWVRSQQRRATQEEFDRELQSRSLPSRDMQAAAREAQLQGSAEERVRREQERAEVGVRADRIAREQATRMRREQLQADPQARAREIALIRERIGTLGRPDFEEFRAEVQAGRSPLGRRGVEEQLTRDAAAQELRARRTRDREQAAQAAQIQARREQNRRVREEQEARQQETLRARMSLEEANARDPEFQRIQRREERERQQRRERAERERVENEHIARERQADARETRRREQEEGRLGAQGRLGPRGYEADLVQQREIERQRMQGYRIEARQRIASPILAEKELDSMRDKLITLQREMGNVSARRMGTDLGQEAGRMSQHLGQVQARMRALREEIAKPANMQRTGQELAREMETLRREFTQTQERARQMKQELAASGPAESPGANSPFRRGLFGYGGYGGIGSAISRFALYGGLYQTISSVKQLTEASLENAGAQAQSEVALASATRQAGLLASANETIVNSLRLQAGMSRTIANEVTAASTRFATTAGLPGQEGNLARILTNIGTSRGVAPDKISELIDQATHEQGRFAQNYLGVSPEAIYRQYAMRHRTELEAGYPERRTLQQDVSSLGDMEKRRALIEAIEQRQGQFTTAEADRMASVAGQADRAKGKWDDLTSSMGQFILTSDVLIKNLQVLSGVVNWLTPERQAQGTGPGGAMTQADMMRLQNQFNTSGGANFTGAISATAGALFRSLPLGGIDVLGAYQNRSLLPLIPGVGAVIGASQAQNTLRNQQAGEYADRLRVQQQSQFRQLQQAGRVVYRDAAGKEYTQQQLDALTQQQRQQVLSNFQFGTGAGEGQGGRGYRIEGDEAFRQRMKKVYDEQIATVHEMQAAEEKFTYELGHRTNALAILRRVQDSLPQTQATVSQGLGGDNPFVKSLTQYGTAVERVEHEWGGFSQTIQRGFVDIEKSNALFDLSKTRIETNIAATRELAEAKRLEMTATLEMTAAEERGLRVLEARLQAAARIPQLQLEIKTLGQFRAPSGFEQEQFGRWTLDRLMTERQIAVGTPGSRARERVFDEALRGFVNQYPIEMLRNARTPFARQLRSARMGLDQREIYRLYEDIDVEGRRAQVGDMAAQEAQTLLRSLPRLRQQALSQGRRAGLGETVLANFTRRVDDSVRGQILAITGALGERELTPELRQARINALREDAAARLRMETQAQATRQQTLVFIAQILAEVQTYRKQIGQKGAAGFDVSVTVENDTLARTDQKALKELSTGFAAEQESRATRLSNPYAGGSSFGGVPTIP